jgi:uncharacterized membrane protein YbjE (DUF340 family)
VTWLVLASVAGGLLLGRLTGAVTLGDPRVEQITTVSLCVLLVCVGYEVGSPGEHWQELRRLGFRSLWVPAAIAVGSIAGPVLIAPLLKLPALQAATIGAGFGWYSLAGVLLAKVHSPALGALGFLTNVIRELLAFVLIPVLAVRLDPLAAIAPAGATAMDTTLPMIQRAAGSTTAIIAFVSGAVLSSAVPVLVPLLAKLCP